MRTAESPPSEPDSPGELQTLADLRPDVRAALERRWQGGVLAHRSLALPLETFARDLLLLWRRGKGRLGLRADEAALASDLPGLHCEDLYLTRLCERGDESAWSALIARFEPDLRGVLQRHVGAQEAAQLAAAVMADAALPPVKKPDRTQVGSYEGSGPLWAWFATIGMRRVYRQRTRREVALEAVGEPEAPSVSSGVALSEESGTFLTALQRAWAALEPRESLALMWKHRDGLSQREVARLLDVSEPTVSRIVQQAVAKVRGQVAGVVESAPGASESLWTCLESALSTHLATLPPAPHRRVDLP